jgi:capsular polysaccharide transport system permease protein
MPQAGLTRWNIALRNQINVLPAIFYRDADSRHGRSFLLGYVASAIEPLSIVLVLGFLFSILARHTPYGRSLLLFLGTGVFPIYLFIHTSVRMRQSLGIGKHRVRFPIERPLDLVFIHAIQHFLMNLVVAALFFWALYSFGIEAALPQDPLMAISALCAIFLFGLAMGIVNSVIARILPIWDLVWPAIARTTLHFSGLYYVAAYLPPSLRWIFAFNPVLHGTNWFRRAFYPFYPQFASDKLVLLMAGLTMLTFGLLLESATRQYLEAKE